MNVKLPVFLFIILFIQVEIFSQDNRVYVIGEQPSGHDHYSVFINDSYIDSVLNKSISDIVARFIEEEPICHLKTCDFKIYNRFSDTISFTQLTNSFIPNMDKDSIYLFYDFSSYVLANHKRTFKFEINTNGRSPKYFVYVENGIIKDNYLMFRVVFKSNGKVDPCRTYGSYYYVVIKDWLLNKDYVILNDQEFIFSDLPSSLNEGK